MARSLFELAKAAALQNSTTEEAPLAIFGVGASQMACFPDEALETLQEAFHGAVRLPAPSADDAGKLRQYIKRNGEMGVIHVLLKRYRASLDPRWLDAAIELARRADGSPSLSRSEVYTPVVSAVALHDHDRAFELLMEHWAADGEFPYRAALIVLKALPEGDERSFLILQSGYSMASEERDYIWSAYSDFVQPTAKLVSRSLYEETLVALLRNLESMLQENPDQVARWRGYRQQMVAALRRSNSRLGAQFESDQTPHPTEAAHEAEEPCPTDPVQGALCMAAKEPNRASDLVHQLEDPAQRLEYLVSVNELGRHEGWDSHGSLANALAAEELVDDQLIDRSPAHVALLATQLKEAGAEDRARSLFLASLKAVEKRLDQLASQGEGLPRDRLSQLGSRATHDYLLVFRVGADIAPEETIEAALRSKGRLRAYALATVAAGLCGEMGLPTR